jgi:hypothetical protein
VCRAIQEGLHSLQNSQREKQELLRTKLPQASGCTYVLLKLQDISNASSPPGYNKAPSTFSKSVCFLLPGHFLLKAAENRHTWLISVSNQSCSPVIPYTNLLCVPASKHRGHISLQTYAAPHQEQTVQHSVLTQLHMSTISSVIVLTAVKPRQPLVWFRITHLLQQQSSPGEISCISACITQQRKFQSPPQFKPERFRVHQNFRVLSILQLSEQRPQE